CSGSFGAVRARQKVNAVNLVAKHDSIFDFEGFGGLILKSFHHSNVFARIAFLISLCKLFLLNEVGFTISVGLISKCKAVKFDAFLYSVRSL
ncbi:hypothetical protein C3E98_029515, partial [Pseudomonas sp. MWU13-2625]